MPMFGPYTYTARDGKRFTVEVLIDPKRIADALAQKAHRSANHLASAQAGGVMVKAQEVPL